jgi:ATP-dependent DNA ligase
VTVSYPEVATALRALPAGLVLDGESSRSRPSPRIGSRRFGRCSSARPEAPSADLIARVPVAYVVFDVLAADAALVIDEPYRERRERLDALRRSRPDDSPRADSLASDADAVETRLRRRPRRRQRGHRREGPGSPYTPGRRGKTWIKLKRRSRRSTSS